ncbi:MAG: magnesium chelatase subunit D [Sandaracinaceae bacterium]
MTARPATPQPSGGAWAAVARAVELFAVDPVGLGGVLLRAGPPPQRDRVLAWVRALLPAGAPVLRVPLHITDDRLLGGVALAETLQTGRLVTEQGLLARADGGVLVVPMAERIEASVLSHLGQALDRGEVALEREGLAEVVRCRVGVVALDEGIDDEAAPSALADRLAFHLDLAGPELGSLPDLDPDPAPLGEARRRLGSVVLPDAAVAALCRAAAALGVPSLRAALRAAGAARAHAALHGRAEVAEDDLGWAARLVLGPRATRLPEPPADEDAPEPPPDEAPPDDAPDDEPEDAPPDALPAALVLEAAKSGIPPGLLDALRLERVAPRGRPAAGKAGAERRSLVGGRPAGTLAAAPRPGERLNLVDTLRAAAPWQRLRRRPGRARSTRRVEVRKADFRVTRFRERTETTVIFCVDASGSAALQRLAEAKGAVEQVLADCYVRRDQVALIAFRGREASLLLPPTRSLTRARRCLAALAGGGTTPLAAGLDAALALALDARRRGSTPLAVVMTDGRANVARDGEEGAGRATADALASAGALREARVPVLFLDTAPRPRPRAETLARAMDARYLPLPYLDAAGVSREVQALNRAPAGWR